MDSTDGSQKDAKGRFDVCVVGAGTAGYTLAVRCAAAGLKTAIVEQAAIGGTCLNTGCVPTKTLLQAGHDLLRLSLLGDEGITLPRPGFDLGRLMDRKSGIVDHLAKGIGFLFKKHGVRLFNGSARLESADTVIVDSGINIHADRIVLATGSVPSVPPSLAGNPLLFLTSETIFGLRELPPSLLVVGGGFIGCEFAFAFRAFGCAVTVVEQLPVILGSFDAEVRREIEKHLKKAGIEILVSTSVDKLTSSPGGISAALSNAVERVFAKVLVASGRRPLPVPGLDRLGIATDRGRIIADPLTFETSVRGIFAIGDSASVPMLAHKASDDAERLADYLIRRRMAAASIFVPQVLYTVPEAASVGPTEEELSASGVRFKKTVVPFLAVGRARVLSETAGFCKILTDADRLLAAHLVGPLVSEIVPFFTLALERAIPLSGLARCVIPHPTLSEIARSAFNAEGSSR